MAKKLTNSPRRAAVRLRTIGEHPRIKARNGVSLSQTVLEDRQSREDDLVAGRLLQPPVIVPRRRR